MMFVMRTNKRRNLTSSQWAAIAVEADEMIQAIREQVEKERREKLADEAAANLRDRMGHFISRPVNLLTQPVIKEDNTKRTDHKLAETFNTNRTYINEAVKLRESQPERVSGTGGY